MRSADSHLPNVDRDRSRRSDQIGRGNDHLQFESQLTILSRECGDITHMNDGHPLNIYVTSGLMKSQPIVELTASIQARRASFEVAHFSEGACQGLYSFSCGCRRLEGLAADRRLSRTVGKEVD